VKFGYESNGCKDTITKIISINVAWSDLILTPDTTICFNTTKQLRAQPALSFCWSPATWLNNPNTQNPVTSTTGKITYYYTAEVPGANLVRNSDFGNGNVDFTSSYQYSATGFNPAQYFVGPDPVLWHPQMAACKDHTTGTGNMLLVNGAQQINAKIWSQTITVTPNTNYAFSAWLQNISTMNPARLQFSINDVPLGNIFEANSTSCIWDQFYSSWNSGNQTTATISIVNMNQLFSGNDFALDDISFAPVYIQRDSVIISIDTPVVFTRTDTTICKDGQVQLQASGAASYSWTPAAGLSNPAIGNPVATPAINTEYIVTGTNAYGCAAKDTVNIHLFPIPTVMADRTLNVCPGIPVQLSANNTLTAWSWAPATGLSNTAISDPIAAPAVNTEYTVTATTTDGCTVKDTIDVNLYTLPTVITDRTLNACPETPVQLDANNTLASWSWTPAAGLSSTTISNPVATPAANTEYIVNGTTINGCIVKDTIDINLYLLPAVIPDRIANICTNTSIQLSANNSLTAWSWSPATGLNSTTINNPVAKPAVNTAYMVTAKTSDGCAVKDTIDINLYAVPTVITDHDITACPNVPLQLSANNNMTSWSWTPALYLNNPAIANPMATPAKSLTYTVQVKDPNNCVYSDTVNIQLLETRFALFVSSHSICQGSPALLQVLGGDSWLWSPAASLNGATIANPIATPDTTTLYTVTAKESTCGKDSTMYVQVKVSPVPVIAVTKENYLNCVVHTTRLHVSGTPGTTYLWSPVNGLDHPNVPDPVSAPDTTTRYYVTGSNKYGCKAVDSITVYVEAEGKVTFMVPNAFTPNNDGRNDCFGVKSWGGATIEEFSVFNRWGQRVFSSKNATACWNGRFNGELQPSGGYVYVITAKTFCGRIKRTGTVMLVR
jgi:gliding motility-associated-like protein